MSHTIDINTLIINIYYTWPTYSKSHDFQEMANITVPNSGFSEMTNQCEKSWDLGINCYYKFKSLEVIKIIKNPPYAEVKGVIMLIQSNQEFISKGKFLSSCVLDTNDPGKNRWKLKDIEIEWEF